MDYNILEKYAVVAPIGANLQENERYKALEEDGWVTNEILGSLKHFYLLYIERTEDDRNAFEKFLHLACEGDVLAYDTTRREKQNAVSIWKNYIKINDYQYKMNIYLPYKDMTGARFVSRQVDSKFATRRMELSFTGGEVLSLELDCNEKVVHETDKVVFGTDEEETAFLNNLIQKAKSSTREERLSDAKQLGDKGKMGKHFVIFLVIFIVAMVLLMIFRGMGIINI